MTRTHRSAPGFTGLFTIYRQKRKSWQKALTKTESLEHGAKQGMNDFRRVGYGGPCPPPGSPHRYFFKLYALDAPTNLKPRATKQQLLDAIKGHILGEAQLMGRYGR